MIIDIENVIKGLEHCVEKLDTVVNKAHGFNCITCPYFRKCDRSGYLIGLPLMRDAIALLKAQEPRVMTLEEVREKKPFMLWVEDLDTGAQVFQVACIEGDYRDRACDWCTDVEIEQDEDYGKRWRYWDKRPTEGQREATPWN